MGGTLARPRTRRRRLTEAAARQLLAEARRSGWSVSEAARRAGLPYTTLHAWKRKLAVTPQRGHRQRSAFVEVHMPTSAATPTLLELQTPSGFTLRLPTGFAAADLQRILEAPPRIVIALPHAARIYLALGATDMRKSYDALAEATRTRIGEDPLSGHLFVFCTGGRNRLKILYWDGSGYWLFAKRLERGSFAWPGRLASGETAMEMQSHELMALVGGIDLRRAVQSPRYVHPSQSARENKERMTLGA